MRTRSGQEIKQSWTTAQAISQTIKFIAKKVEFLQNIWVSKVLLIFTQIRLRICIIGTTKNCKGFVYKMAFFKHNSYGKHLYRYLSVYFSMFVSYWNLNFLYYTHFFYPSGTSRESLFSLILQFSSLSYQQP